MVAVETMKNDFVVMGGSPPTVSEKDIRNLYLVAVADSYVGIKILNLFLAMGNLFFQNIVFFI
jgi:hypothetical protein